MTTVSYPLRIPHEIIEISKLKSEDQHVDQATALRQFLFVGAEEYVLQLVAEGMLSIGKSAELLNTSVYDIYRIAKRHGIQLGPTPEQTKKAKKYAEEIL